MGKEFDNFIKNKLEQRHIEFNEAHWEDALQLIEANAKNPKPIYMRLRFWMAILAGILFLGLSYYGLQHYFDKDQSLVQNELSRSDTPQSSATAETSLSAETAALNIENAEKITLATAIEDAPSSKNQLTNKSIKRNSTQVTEVSTQNIPSNLKPVELNTQIRQSSLSPSEITLSNSEDLVVFNPSKTNKQTTADKLSEKVINSSIFIKDAELAEALFMLPVPGASLINPLEMDMFAESPEVLGDAALPGAVQIAAIGGAGGYGNFDNTGLQLSMGAMLQYSINDKWSVSLAPQFFGVRRFNHVLEEQVTQSFSFGAETNHYSLENEWQLGVEMPITVGMRLGNSRIWAGPTLRWNMLASGALQNNITSSFESREITAGTGQIDPQLYQALNIGMHLSYQLQLNKNNSIILYGNQYINPFWRTDAKSDLSLGIMFSHRLF